MVRKDFLDAMDSYNPLRLAVYSPSSIPLAERKLIAEFLFSSLNGDETPRVPGWFSAMYKALAASSAFKELGIMCDGNPVLTAQIAAEIIRALDKTIEELLEALRKLIEAEKRSKEEEQHRPKGSVTTSPNGKSGGSIIAQKGEVSGGENATEDLLENLRKLRDSKKKDSTIAQKGEVSGEEEVTEGFNTQAISDSKMSTEMKSRIEEILKGIALIPLQLSTKEIRELSPATKQSSQTLLTKSLEDALEEVLASAKDWTALYELLISILPGLGWDYSPGFLKHNLLSKYRELAQLLDKIPELKELANRLGRYHSLMGEKIWDPTTHGKSEVFSVERSGDIERILPGELVQLGYPATKYLFYSKLADKSLLTYELKGEGWTRPEEKERGPVIVCIDTSGSMTGLPESIAKAVSLAVAKEANSQSRKVVLILFGSRNETHEYVFDKSENAIDSLMSFLNLSFGGGTDFDSALSSTLEFLDDEDYRRADVLFVTDGYGEIRNMQEDIERIKRELGTRFFTLLVESDDSSALQGISDEVWILHLTQGTTPSLSRLRSVIRNRESGPVS